MRQPKPELCLCGSQKPFRRCCDPYLAGEALAPTAEALMRSRYSAFCQSNFDYLVATRKFSLESPTAQAEEREALARTAKNIRWMNLTVVATQKGKSQHKTGVVEFVAVYQAVSQPVPQAVLPIAAQLPQREEVTNGWQQLHERSRFIKEQGQWLYTTGDLLPPYQPQRKQPCWCGSEQPFGRCHGT